jgi:hypothetical protein
MNNLAHNPPPVPDTDIADAIAAWLRRAPPRILLELADGESRSGAAAAIGELIAAHMTMAYPELVESSAPPLPF